MAGDSFLLPPFLQGLILRDVFLLNILSIAFELMEYTLACQLPNFGECWWDHVSDTRLLLPSHWSPAFPASFPGCGLGMRLWPYPLIAHTPHTKVLFPRQQGGGGAWKQGYTCVIGGRVESKPIKHNTLAHTLHTQHTHSGYLIFCYVTALGSGWGWRRVSIWKWRHTTGRDSGRYPHLSEQLLLASPWAV